MRRRRAQRRASSATKSTRSASGRCATAPYSVPASRRFAALKDMARVRIRPSISGSATCIARSEGPSPRCEARQASSPNAREHDLQDWRVERVKRGSLLCVETGGERGGVQDDVKAPPIEKGV